MDMEQLSQIAEKSKDIDWFKTSQPARAILKAIESEKPTNPPQWGAAAARYIGKPKGGLTPNQLYRVICLSFDGEQLTVKNGYGKEQIAPASSFIKPHDKPPKKPATIEVTLL